VSACSDRAVFVALCNGGGEVARVWRRCLRLVLKSRACACATRKTGRNVKWLIYLLLSQISIRLIIGDEWILDDVELSQTTLPHSHTYLPYMYVLQASIHLLTYPAYVHIVSCRRATLEHHQQNRSSTPCDPYSRGPSPALSIFLIVASATAWDDNPSHNTMVLRNSSCKY
jgi:hypothetical protein